MLTPNTAYTFKVKVADRAVSLHVTTWSDAMTVYTLADVPGAPVMDSTGLNSISVTLDPGSNPASTELALWNNSDKTWVALDGSASATEVWADAATWSTVAVSGLDFDTTYHLQAKARNGDGIETALSPILAVKTAAPDSQASVAADRVWIYDNLPGSTANQVNLSASFVNDPYPENTDYTYTWQSHTHPITGLSLTLAAGGTPTDDTATWAAPESSTDHPASYLVTCTITGNPTGNSVSKTLAIEVRPLVRTDFDKDGDVDEDDLGHFTICASGPAIPQTDPDCEDAKLDTDGDVDQADFAVFQRCYSGEDAPADPACAG